MVIYGKKFRYSVPFFIMNISWESFVDMLLDDMSVDRAWLYIHSFFRKNKYYYIFMQQITKNKYSLVNTFFSLSQ